MATGADAWAETPGRAPTTTLGRVVAAATRRLLHWRQRGLVASLCRRVGAPACVLDVPWGNRRAAPLLSRSTPLLVCADIDARRFAALEAAISCAGLARAALRPVRSSRTSAFELVVHLRYLEHAGPGVQEDATLADLVGRSGRYVVLSYFRRRTWHWFVHAVRTATGASPARPATMMARGELARLAARLGCRIVAERSVLPGLHARSFVLMEKNEPTMLRPRSRRVRTASGCVAPPRRRRAGNARA